MFHYRLVPQNNRSRMLIAVFMAVALHVGLMNFEFGTEPVSIPEVSLPLSVSVFLGQKPMDDIQDQQKTNNQTVKSLIDDQAAEREPEMYLPPKSSAVQKKKETTVSRPVLSEQTVEPAVEVSEEKNSPTAEFMPANQRVENINTEDNRAAILKTATTGIPQNVKEKTGVPLPGTLQMAYPRYQLNAPPPYPGLARKRGLQGTVILQVLVNKEGRVDDLKIDASSNFSMLDRAAVKAVRKWSFEPGKKGEERISMWVKVPVTFQLK